MKKLLIALTLLFNIVIGFGQVNFEVIDMFIHESGLIDFKNAVGYKGKYNDKYGEHTIYVIHAINNKKGLQIFFDVLTGLFDELDDEFKMTLKSIKTE